MSSNPALVALYNATRGRPQGSPVCHAPTTNLNFEQNGNITVCCYNRSFVLGTYPQNTLDEIWHGERIGELRRSIAKHDLSQGCHYCQEQLSSQNFGGLKAQFYDSVPDDPAEDPLRVLPRMMEFETSNLCNLECVMCSGHFSSLIRSRREKLPPIPNPYDAAFVEQLRPYLKSLVWAKFLGGEPFLNPLYFKIWDVLAEVNPKVRISVTTNGSVLTDRVKGVLEALSPFIVMSVDSLVRERYEAIRQNASYDQLRDNIAYFLDYARRKDRPVNFAVCPMRSNWQDLPELLEFCNANAIQVFFNMVFWPAELSLKTLPPRELTHVISSLRSASLTPWVERPEQDNRWTRFVYDSNGRVLSDFILQLETWRQATRPTPEALTAAAPPA